MPNSDKNSHPDHLNTPRLVADATGTTVWRWDQQEPFGNNVPDENPSGLGIFDLPLRLPGQYFDKETNLHYNYFRDYDPGLGQFKQSDPIGLKGGLSTYTFVSNKALQYVDLFGLENEEVARWGWPDTPTRDQVAKALKEAIKSGRICLGFNDDCSDLHERVYKLCTGLFANVGAVVCKIEADEIATDCILDPDKYKCPKVACDLPRRRPTSAGL